jgi:alkaline phosphatase D
VLWTRLTGDELPAVVPVRWELAHDEAFTRVAARGEEVATVGDAHSVHAEPSGLDPARGYFYRFDALGQRSTVGRARTAPAPGAAVAQLDFAIASCQRYDVGHYAAWRDAAGQALDLVLFLGDYIYEYATGPAAVRTHTGGKVRSLVEYRERYALYKSDPALQAAHAACPWIVIWDDHEVDNDYAGLQGQDLQPDFASQRAAAYQAWWEHMPLPKALRPRDGSVRVHHRLDWGRLARLHALDDRQYRDPQACPRPGRGGSNVVRRLDCPQLRAPQRTLLGAEQERWLAEGWSLERPWNLIAQQTLMARFHWDDPARGDDGRVWTDGWDGYPAARQRLLSVLAERRVSGAVVLGGDVHSHYVADLHLDADDAKSPCVATEFCGTSISSLGQPQARIDAALPFNPHIHYGRSDQRGYVRFTLRPERLEADLRAVADARDPASAVGTAARYVVEAGRPGARRA